MKTETWKYAAAVQDNGPNYFVVSDGKWRSPAVAICYTEERARLIAATPKLLAALNACVERMAELQKHTNYPLAWPRVQAAEALAKATGGAS